MYVVFSHEEEEDFMLDHSGLYPINQLQAVGYGSLIFGILIAIIILFHEKMHDMAKKIVYSLVVITASLVTIYLVITTLHLNIISETKGPVHWHADFEIWVCGKKIELAEPKGLSNKQGVDLMHAHNDNRIHVEGVLLDKKAASLGAFFYAIGGSLSSDGLIVPTNEGLASFHEGDKCNEKPAKLYGFVNGNLIDNPSAYIISPYEKVPPGDRIKFVFTEETIEEINTYLKDISNNNGLPPDLETPKTGVIPQTRADDTTFCDLDLDGECNNNDLTIFDALIGKCGNEFYKSDFDDDGCITSTDRDLYSQLYNQINKNIKP